MKLITELNETVQVVAESTTDSNGRKNLFIEGVFLQAEIKNRNGRVYPKQVMEREVNRYIKEYVSKNRAFGELNHPSGPQINLERVSHMITSLKQDGNNWVGRAKIMTETPMGSIIKGILDEGGQIGVSSRGMGSLKESQGVQVVQDDFYLATAADIVSDPSAPDAFVRGIMEGREWVYGEHGELIEVVVDDIRKTIKATPSKRLDEEIVKAFERYVQARLKEGFRDDYGYTPKKFRGRATFVNPICKASPDKNKRHDWVVIGGDSIASTMECRYCHQRKVVTDYD